MRVFIAGATGVLGRRLVRLLAERGHDVVGLSRHEAGDKLVREAGGHAVRANIFDTEALARIGAGADVVVHAATAIPLRRRTRASDWRENDRIRRQGTAALASAAATVGASLYLQQSIVWVARPDDGSFFDEESPPNPDRTTRSALDGEEIAMESGERGSFRVAVLRCGMFYAADAAHTRVIARGLRRRRLPVPGRGEARWSMIHADDAAAAFLSAMEISHSGLWHIVDDRPVSVAEFLATFADELHAPRPSHIPVWLTRLIAGGNTARMLTTSTLTASARFRRDTGWAPHYPTIRAGLRQVAADLGG
jgi:nucleoside-diphosphate-sugar epimerase